MWQLSYGLKIANSAVVNNFRRHGFIPFVLSARRIGAFTFT